MFPSTISKKLSQKLTNGLENSLFPYYPNLQYNRHTANVDILISLQIPTHKGIISQ